MKSLWPKYSDSVDFYALETDPSPSLSDIGKLGVERGYPWPMGRADRSALSALGVLGQSTKIAFDASGTIVYRDGFSGGDVGSWRGVFEDLAGQ